MGELHCKYLLHASSAIDTTVIECLRTDCNKQGIKKTIQLKTQLVPRSKHLSLHFLFLLLHRACCRVNQLLHQPLHIYKIYKIYTLKH